MKKVKQRAKQVTLSSLKHHPKNPRRADVKAITESILENGFYGTVYVQESTGYIVAGNGRYEAAFAAGAKKSDKIHAIFLDITDEEAERIVLADNATSDKAVYDNDPLKALLQDLAESERGLAGTGYSDKDLQKMIKSLDDGYGGGSEQVGRKPAANVGVTIGPYRFKVHREAFDRWENQLKEEAGFATDEILDELKRRLQM